MEFIPFGMGIQLFHAGLVPLKEEKKPDFVKILPFSPKMGVK
jgi:hypothetical protein